MNERNENNEWDSAFPPGFLSSLDKNWETQHEPTTEPFGFPSYSVPENPKGNELSEESDENSGIYDFENLSKGVEKGSNNIKREATDPLLRFPIITAQDLVSESDSTEWLIDGLIPIGSVVMLAGVPGSYKTWFFLFLEHAIAEGKEFLGSHTHPGITIHVDRENPKNVIRERVMKIGTSINHKFWGLWEDPEPPLLINPRSDDYLMLGGGVSLITIDSFRKFHGMDENDSKPMAQVMDKLRKLTKHGTTVLILHHSGKNAVYRGSTEILAGVDVAFYIEKTNEKDGSISLKLECFKHRYVKEQNIEIKFQIDGKGASFHEAISHREQETLGKVWGIIRSHKKMMGTWPNQNQIVKEIKGKYNIGKDATLSLLKEGEGTWWESETEGEGRPMLYNPLIPWHLVPN